jgi:hypothetical protein
MSSKTRYKLMYKQQFGGIHHIYSKGQHFYGSHPQSQAENAQKQKTHWIAALVDVG